MFYECGILKISFKFKKTPVLELEIYYNAGAVIFKKIFMTFLETPGVQSTISDITFLPFTLFLCKVNSPQVKR